MWLWTVISVRAIKCFAWVIFVLLQLCILRFCVFAFCVAVNCVQESGCDLHTLQEQECCVHFALCSDFGSRSSLVQLWAKSVDIEELLSRVDLLLTEDLWRGDCWQFLIQRLQEAVRPSARKTIGLGSAHKPSSSSWHDEQDDKMMRQGMMKKILGVLSWDSQLSKACCMW